MENAGEKCLKSTCKRRFSKFAFWLLEAWLCMNFFANTCKTFHLHSKSNFPNKFLSQKRTLVKCTVKKLFEIGKTFYVMCFYKKHLWTFSSNEIPVKSDIIDLKEIFRQEITWLEIEQIVAYLNLTQCKINKRFAWLRFDAIGLS